MSLIAFAMAAALAAPQDPGPLLPPIDEEAAAGVEAYRISFERLDGYLTIDDYGDQRVVVIFERRPGAAPHLIARLRDREMQAAVPEAVWERVQREGWDMARAIGPNHQSVGGGVDDICVGALLYTTVETTRRLVLDREGNPWRRWHEEVTCGTPVGLIGGFGDEAARIAIDLLSPCDSLPAGVWPVRDLVQCLWLDGDRLAAAQFIRDRRPIPEGPNARPQEWRAWMAADLPDLDWPGYQQWVDAAQESDDRAERMEADEMYSDQSWFIAEQAALMRGLHFRYTSVRGDSAGQVTTTGLITGRRPGSDDDQVVAVDHQVWVSDGGNWSLKAWRVGPFRPEE